MTQQAHTFEFSGPFDHWMVGMITTGTFTSLPMGTGLRKVLTVENDNPNHIIDAISEMTRHGFVYIGPGDLRPPPGSTLTQRVRDVLDEDLGTHGPGDGWVTVAETAFTTLGGTDAEVTFSVAASVLIGAEARAVIDGGAFTDMRVASAEFPLLGASAVSYTSSTPIPATEAATTYTVRLEVRAVGLVAAVTLNAVSDANRNAATLIVKEHR